MSVGMKRSRDSDSEAESPIKRGIKKTRTVAQSVYVELQAFKPSALVSEKKHIPSIEI